MIQLRPYQNALVQDVHNRWNSGEKNVLAVLPTGGGKCFARDTQIMLFNGTTKPVQDVLTDDLLMGPDSKPRRVVKTCSGIDKLYEIIPSKGDSYTVNSKHVLSLRKTGLKSEPRYPSQDKKGEITNITVTDYIKSSKYFKHVNKGWRTSISFSKQQRLKYDPYYIGLWLGDGTTRNANITTMDQPILEYLIKFADKYNLTVRHSFDLQNNKATFVSIGDQRNGKYNKLIQFLKNKNLIQNKHIPHSYKTAHRIDRLKLLAGFIDSDGYYTGKGFDIVQKSERLLDDVIFVARSLGFSAYKKAVKKTCTNNGVTGDYFRCTISGEIDKIPCILERKKARPRRQIKNVLNVGITVKPVGVGEYFGFEVEGPDALFLLSDFTVTHNSVCISEIALNGYRQGMMQVIFAHRSELVGQMSGHVAARGIPHRIIGPRNVMSQIAAQHRRDHGRSFINPDANTAVASVQTIAAREKQLGTWAEQIDRWTCDEAHHVIGGKNPNLWGRAIKLFPRAHGLGVTATPSRADGQGLGAAYDGVFDSMVTGPSMRELINAGYLSEYQIAIPESDFYIEETVTKTGDFSRNKMREASKRSHIVGDVVTEYLRLAPGKQGICFATDVETAKEIANNFKAAGVRAESVSAKTDGALRAEYIRRFRAGEITMLVNVDLFGEGFDVPAVEVVIMARPTASLGVYLQQFGRALRIMDGKLFGLVIDHVSNWKRHGLPDKAHQWALARREKRAKSVPDPEDIPLTACKGCSQPYERFHKACPYCGTVPVVGLVGRQGLERVDGDLMLLTAEALAKMRAETVLETPASIGARVGGAAGDFAAKRAINKQMDTIQKQQLLAAAIDQWAGVQRHKGREDSEIYRRFYIATGVDTLTAQTLSRRKMEQLTETIQSWYS